MRLGSALWYDVKLQWRHGFYLVYAVVSGFYLVLLHSIASEWRAITATIFTFSDPSVLGFFFIGGLVLLEKGQNLFDNLFVTPFTPTEYILSKTGSLSLLSVLASLAIHWGAFGLGTDWGLLLAGVLATSIFFTLTGLGFAVRSRTVNGFFLWSSMGTFVFMFPLFELVGLYSSPWLWLLPTKASLLLIHSPFVPLSAAELLYACLNLGLWTAMAYVWAKRSLVRYVVWKGEGSGT